PERGLVIFITVGVILGTLVLQGLSLPFVIRWLKIVDDRSLDEEERQARLKANRAALARITKVTKERKIDEDTFDRLRAEYEDRIEQLAKHESDDDEEKLTMYSPQFERLSQEALDEERRTIVELRNARVINDHVLRGLQTDVDLAEARLQQGHREFGM